MVLASGLTGWFTLVASNKQRKLDSFKNRLKQAYRDIAAYHRLEERYTDELAKNHKTSTAWKREFRKNLRDDGFSSPSEDATSQIAEQRLKELGEN